MALTEQVDKRRRELVTGEGWSGVAHIRVFTCPKGEVAGYRSGELAEGSILPEKWGGVSTSEATDPMLQSCVDLQPPQSAQAELETVWVSINPASAS